MSVIVQKYGGSSLADPEHIGMVAERVVAARQRGHDVVVVVSAIGSTTEDLLALADRVTNEPCERERDMLVTAGERIATALLCMALQTRGCESISFTGSQAGILTNDRHQDARIIEVRPVRVQDELARGKVVVVAGYQGMSYKREITSLGRGGSDTTAIALAAALDAEAAEIYSDVDGVYTADPDRVPDAVRLDEIDLGAMEALARGGARVIAAQAVELARRQGVVLYCRATDPARGDGSTLVRRFPPGDPGVPRVAAIHGDAVGSTLLTCPGAASAAVLRALDGMGTPAEMVLHAGDVTALLVGRSARGVAAAARGVQVVDPVGRLTLVGHRLDAVPGLVAQLFGLFEAEGVTPLALATTPEAATILVPAEHVDPLVRAIHDAVVI